ncbi:MAG: polysaccharide biosynthesis/export family protein, partial [Isosphaeraceae bacterium]
MIAGMLSAPCRRTLVVVAAICLTLVPGCAGTGRKHEARRVPDRGYIDPEQARELDKVTMPRYVVEPPDELEIAIKPAPPDWNLGTVTVQQDGVIDLGFAGDVYVVGLTLDEIELKIAQQLTAAAMQQNQKIDQPYRVSVRLANVQSKYYYVMGAVTTQGRFPIKGNETVLDAILQAGL